MSQTSKFTRRPELAHIAMPAAYRQRTPGETLRKFLVAMTALETIVNERVDVQYAGIVASEALGDAYMHYYETQTQKARDQFIGQAEYKVAVIRNQAKDLVGSAIRFANAADDGFGAAKHAGVTVAVYTEEGDNGKYFRFKVSRIGAPPVQRWSKDLALIAVAKMLAEVTL